MTYRLLVLATLLLVIFARSLSSHQMLSVGSPAFPSPNYNPSFNRPILVGGYSDRNKRVPPHIDALVKRSHPELRFATILNVQSQVVAGTNYKITYKGLRNDLYQAVVFEQPWTRTLRITSFRRI